MDPKSTILTNIYTARFAHTSALSYDRIQDFHDKSKLILTSSLISPDSSETHKENKYHGRITTIVVAVFSTACVVLAFVSLSVFLVYCYRFEKAES